MLFFWGDHSVCYLILSCLSHSLYISCHSPVHFYFYSSLDISFFIPFIIFSFGPLIFLFSEAINTNGSEQTLALLPEALRKIPLWWVCLPMGAVMISDERALSDSRDFLIPQFWSISAGTWFYYSDKRWPWQLLERSKEYFWFTKLHLGLGKQPTRAERTQK